MLGHQAVPLYGKGWAAWRLRQDRNPIPSSVSGQLRGVTRAARKSCIECRSGFVYRLRLVAEGVLPERGVEVNSYHAILGCVAAGVGITMLPRCLLQGADPLTLSVLLAAQLQLDLQAVQVRAAVP